jgi:hypothetical protein
VALATGKGVRIDLASFAPPFLAAFAMMLAAAHYRLSGRSPTIALAMASCAIFILFTNAGAAFNYALLPTGRPLIDGALFRADAAIGFDWTEFSSRIADYPRLSAALGYVYQSSLFQLAAIILLLGFSGRQVALHRFLIVGVFAGCLSIGVWALAPSFGPSAYIQLDAAVDARLGRVVSAHHGAQLLQLARDGVSVIDGKGMVGLIAFPSMHTVMACMSVWFVRRTVAFWPSVVLNVSMIPAIVIHGGHHLVDVVAGIATFALVLYAACRLIPDAERSEGREGRPEPLPDGIPLGAAAFLAPVATMGENQA